MTSATAGDPSQGPRTVAQSSQSSDASHYGPLAYLFGTCPDCHRNPDEAR